MSGTLDGCIEASVGDDGCAELVVWECGERVATYMLDPGQVEELSRALDVNERAVLLERIRELETELTSANDTLAMCCETPADDCSCAGCRYADEGGRAKPEQET